MNGQVSVIPIERTERAIIVVRGQKVMLDSDLTEIYGVESASSARDDAKARFCDICVTIR